MRPARAPAVPDPVVRRRGLAEGSGRARLRERGGATPMVLGLVAVLFVVLVAVGLLGRAVGARGEARAAADLGALSAATALHSPGSSADPCAEAARVAAANDAALGSCSVEGESVLVTAVVGVDLGVLGHREARATARAGPAGP